MIDSVISPIEALTGSSSPNKFNSVLFFKRDLNGLHRQHRKFSELLETPFYQTEWYEGIFWNPFLIILLKSCKKLTHNDARIHCCLVSIIMITQLTEMFDIISRNLLCQKQYKQHFTKKLYLTHFNDKKM